jgi:hypothetical protein
VFWRIQSPVEFRAVIASIAHGGRWLSHSAASVIDTARATSPLSDRQRTLSADTGRIRRRGIRPTPPALSADPISPSTIECPLRPPNQQSLTREDTGAHCFSLEVTHGELDERGEVARLIRVTHKFSGVPAIEDWPLASARAPFF